MKRIGAFLVAVAVAVVLQTIVVRHPCDSLTPDDWFLWWWYECGKDAAGGGGGGAG